MIEIIQGYWHRWAIVTVLTFVAFFVGFGIKNKYGKGGSSEMGRTFEFLFYSIDWSCNQFLTIFPFFDLPAKPSELVTDRMIRYKKISSITYNERTALQKYRYNLAVLICNILNKGDKGHC